MDIDIQTIIQQDIDLGIEKSFNIDLATTSEWEKYNLKAEELNFLSFKDFEQMQNTNDNSFDLKNNNKKENQFSEDETQKLFEIQQQNIPDGYKLVLEEDTGECFLILVNPENNSIIEKVNWTNSTFNQTINNNNNLIRPKPIDTTTFLNNKTEPPHDEETEEEIEVAVRYSYFNLNRSLCISSSSSNADDDNKYADCAVYEDLRQKFNQANLDENDFCNSKQETISQSALLPPSQPPQFLSQSSINNLLDTFGENVTTTTPLTVQPSSSLNLNDSLSNVFQDNLLNVTWLNNYIQPSYQEQQSNSYDDNLMQPIIAQNQIDINKNQSLLNLNINQSILNDNDNQTTFIMQNNNNNILQQSNLTSMSGFMFGQNSILNANTSGAHELNCKKI
jgi:hypothetical protein